MEMAAGRPGLDSPSVLSSPVPDSMPASARQPAALPARKSQPQEYLCEVSRADRRSADRCRQRALAMAR
jgi:hypothetical protein